MPNRLIENKRPELQELCLRHHVLRLELFGSASRGDFDPRHSDFDFLVELDTEQKNYFDNYFGLKEGLEELLGRPVDLLSVKAVNNPYFLERIASERELLYAA